MAHVDAFVQRLALHDARDEAAREGVPVHSPEPSVTESPRPRYPDLRLDSKTEQDGTESGKNVPSTVGIANVLARHLPDGKGLDLHGDLFGLGSGALARIRDGHDGGIGALRDDDGARSLGVLLRQAGEVLGDGGDVVGVEGVGGGVGAGFGLVADEVVAVGQGGVERGGEELGDEGGGEGEGEDLRGPRRVSGVVSLSALAVGDGRRTERWQQTRGR